MKNLIFVKDYQPLLNVSETEKAIKLIKDKFQKELAKKLSLKRVSAPLFVEPSTGLNDNLSGKEKPVNFKINDSTTLEIVQSLAKWKRYALKKYNLTGLYTDMNAIRPCEDLDNIHSLYVDQWDWEKVITCYTRNIKTLKEVVNKIYHAFLSTYCFIAKKYPVLNEEYSKTVKFITSQQLLDLYPNLSAKDREHEIVKKYKTVFIIGIGNKLSNNSIHDTRAADYDDWSLNGDLLIYNSTLDIAFELSSMGIRVNKESLLSQLYEKQENYKLDYDYHKAILNDELPLTIGGGIGQSRLCMLLLKKAHIGEVQSSFWPKEDIKEFSKYNINLL